MPTLGWILAFSLVGSVLSLAGGLLLVASATKAGAMAKRLTPFAAGVLLATAFLDLVPESSRELGVAATRWVLGGFLAFYLLERLFRSFHQHGQTRRDDHAPSSALVIV
ncbi:MAG TPA: ZIP family metal transporter, partial [Thermoanaerobaculia bacterium]|nr:ZIP family metal transporter [Thermoanaerobaculia bacterium]